MPRYFFNVQDHRNIVDDEGTMLPDLAAARREAIQAAGRILADDAHLHELGPHWAMIVLDDDGRVLLRIDFHVTQPSSSAAGDG